MPRTHLCAVTDPPAALGNAERPAVSSAAGLIACGTND